MTADTISWLRGFGESGAEGFFRWPLDRACEMGLPTVPGVVAEFRPDSRLFGSEAPQTALAGIFADRFSDGLGGVRATLRWRSNQAPRRVGQLLPLLDLPAEPNLLVAKRFVEQFAVDAVGVVGTPFEQTELAALAEHGRTRDRDLPETALSKLVLEGKDHFARQTGMPFPETAVEQFALIVERLRLAAPDPNAWISCCVRRDYSERTSELLGSVRIYSRDLRTGAARCQAYLLPNRPPQELTWGDGGDAIALTDATCSDVPTWLLEHVRRSWKAIVRMDPARIARLDAVAVGAELLIDDYGPVDESAAARVEIAAEAARASDIQQWRSALTRLTKADLDLILTPRLDLTKSPEAALLAKGTGVAAGACSGVLCTTPDAALRYRGRGHPVIYVADHPDPQHIAGIMAADGLVFVHGGVTSHVAVIARGTGRPCVMGVGAVAVEADLGGTRFGERRVPVGTMISMDGLSGAVYAGQMPLVHPAPHAFEALRTVLDRCDAEAGLAVFANADTAQDAGVAVRDGARGIGLCRLEHLLGGSPYLSTLQEALVLAVATAPQTAVKARAARAVDRWGASSGALASLADATHHLDQHPLNDRYRKILADLCEGISVELQAILRVAQGQRVVVRLVDAPGSEFLSPDDIDLASRLNLPPDDYRRAVARLTGSDPALGLRGARLLVLAPEFTAAQVEAIMTAVCLAADVDVHQRVLVDIMVPFVTAPTELVALRGLVKRTVTSRLGADRDVVVRFGAMVETPRAALLAGELAQTADFLSFGTNDLTQFTWACSRDSAGDSFLNHGLYRDLNLAPFDRFDEEGLGALISLAVRQARETAPGIPIGVCGELGVDARAVAFFSRIGIDYVSSTPLRVACARLVAGQRALPQSSTDSRSTESAVVAPWEMPCTS
ncbi:putative PEP-binding protein [Lentzea sp. HUAS12]|uniref:putative PEP-binding protein n=1 Tax=Lentzea sp. HUAS12 TaxID=2951806 RepID=UPI00209CE021|nr:putative PEP-binding protein [Lentzea sp. HUAS12]USX56220.1 PEP-utilizing enzyme [Lentzea sp. HUAS12]